MHVSPRQTPHEASPRATIICRAKSTAADVPQLSGTWICEAGPNANRGSLVQVDTYRSNGPRTVSTNAGTVGGGMGLPGTTRSGCPACSGTVEPGAGP